MKWAFDDYHIGRTKIGSDKLVDRIIRRAPKMTRDEWYRIASEVCHLLNQGRATLDVY